MRKEFVIALALVLGPLSSACSSSDEQTLSVQMLGVSKAPEGAAGSKDPSYLTYKLSYMALLSQDGSESVTLFDAAQAAAKSEDAKKTLEKGYKIVEREQYIVSSPISELVGKSYQKITLRFDSAVSGAVGDKKISFSMAAPEIELAQAFSVSTGKDLVFTLKLSWGNTVDEQGVASEPGYTLTKD